MVASLETSLVGVAGVEVVDPGFARVSALETGDHAGYVTVDPLVGPGDWAYWALPRVCPSGNQRFETVEQAVDHCRNFVPAPARPVVGPCRHRDGFVVFAG